jgi:shikimate kinase
MDLCPEGNIYLIGLMGSGKSTLGRVLARRLHREFVDMDALIESRTGACVSLIFDIEGEAGFRARERALVAELSQKTGLVVATGGGVILDADNRQRLRATGWVIYLEASPDALYERVRQDRSRPLLQVQDPRLRLEQLLRERDGLYRETAHVVMAATQGKAIRLANIIASKLFERKGLPLPPLESPSCPCVPSL